MLRTENKYCSNCLSTQRFLDAGTCLVCERCSKRLERSFPTGTLSQGIPTILVITDAGDGKVKRPAA